MLEASCCDPGVWQALPAELVSRVFGFLPPNELACTIRLVCKAYAELFRHSLVVHLSQPSPEAVFAWKWGNGQAVQNFTLSQRQKLLYLTARSGSIENLRVVIGTAGCCVFGGALSGAAEAGHLVVCRFLAEKGCPASRCVVAPAAKAGHLDVVRWLLRELIAVGTEPIDAVVEQVWVSAADAGRQHVCEGLLADGFAPSIRALFAAAEAGHVGLMDWLLQLQQLQQALSEGSTRAQVLGRAAHGCDLPALQRLYASHLQGPLEGDLGGGVVGGAVGSPTPDWRAKVDWLEDQGFTLRGAEVGWYDVAKAPDAVERFQFVRQRDCLIKPVPLLRGVVSAQNASMLRFLHREGFIEERLVPYLDMNVAAEAGNIPLMDAMLEVGSSITLESFEYAMYNPNLHALDWLWVAAGQLLGNPQFLSSLGRGLMYSAAGTGRVDIVQWLLDRGCPWHEYTFRKAAEAGSPPLLEFLAARGCPMEPDGEPYVLAGRNGDLVTLECLRRLNCPWDDDGLTFTLAVGNTRLDDIDTRDGVCSLEVLRWLHARGCPVDWESARECSALRKDAEAERVRAWIEGQMQAEAS